MTPIKISRALTAQAELSVAQVQDLAEVIGDIQAATVGHDLKLRLAIEIGGREVPSEELKTKVNELLKTVSEKLMAE